MLATIQPEAYLSLFPAIIISLVSLRFFHWVVCFRRGKLDRSPVALVNSEALPPPNNAENHGAFMTILQSDGLAVFSLRATRLFCVLVLLSLSVRKATIEPSSLDVVLIGFYVYVELLSSLSVVSPSTYWRNAASQDVSTSLFVAFLVYFLKDVWPYAMLKPIQIHPQDWITWTRFGLLAFTGVVIPLVAPQSLTKTSGEVDRETTYSLLSRITFSHIDSTVFMAYRSPDLKTDDLPPLSFPQRAIVLARNALPSLDPLLVGKAHIFWGLLHIFRIETAYMCLWTILYAVSRFLSPYALKNLLAYLEMQHDPDSHYNVETDYYNDPPEQIIYKLWVWIILITLAPIITSIFANQYLYNSTLIEVAEESILTQLVFEHALRIRLNSSGGEYTNASSTSSQTTSSDQSLVDEPVETLANTNNPTDTPQTSTAPSASTSTLPTVAELRTHQMPVRNIQKKTSTTWSSFSDMNVNRAKTSVPMLGKINNLLTSDIAQVKNFQNVLNLPSAFVQIGLGIGFLYGIFGWSALVGLAVFVICTPIPIFLSNLILRAQRFKMDATDQRVQSVTEALHVLRTLKVLAWEVPILSQLSDKRENEINWMQYGKLLDVLMRGVETLLPLLSSLAVFGTYTVIMKQPLTPSRAFPALSVFNVLHDQIFIVMYRVPEVLRATVSFDRLNEFLNDTEVLVETPLTSISLNAEDLDNHCTTSCRNPEDERIGFSSASFHWNGPIDLLEESDDESELSPSNSTNHFQLRFDDEVLFKRGKMNLVIGPTAAGKTSLLMALLGEMYYSPHSLASWYNLPRNGGIAYAPQESWVLNATIRENIVFDQIFDELRYRKVLKSCSLEKDLDFWEAGDMTEVGEKGLTLSGGQKARVTLARALYSSAVIVLLDDPLAALDVHTAKHVVNNALRGDLVHDRTIILVTHHLHLAGPLADHVISLGKDGRVVNQGSLAGALMKDNGLRTLADKEKAEREGTDETDRFDTGIGEPERRNEIAAVKLIMEEEKAIGPVESAATMLYIRGVGGLMTWILIIVTSILRILTNILGTWFIGFWASQYGRRPASEVSAMRYLASYSAIVLFWMLDCCINDVFWAFRSIRASRLIHLQLLSSIFRAPLRWLDVVPLGRIMTRCTQDINAVDGPIGTVFAAFIIVTMSLFSTFLTTVIMAGWPSLIAGVIVIVLGGWLGHVYLKAQLSVKREWSNAKSPVITQISTALSGIISIRAYGAQAYFRAELMKRVDAYSRTARTYNDLNRWIALRADVLGGMFAGVVAVSLVYGNWVQPSMVGFTLNLVLWFSSQVLSWVRVYNTLEVQSNSLERILNYLRINQEPLPVESRRPPAYWPASGHLKVEHLSASYADDGPIVLRDINFEIYSGERIGVVGRTGAGKSSIALALLRLVKTDGAVYYDNLSTNTINLDVLRSNITLISQQPELIRGTLRENLDPIGDHDDATLNDALRSARLFDFREEQAEEHQSQWESSARRRIVLSLDTAVESGGTNLSLGQRQIVALARAIVRRSKLFILDEATAAIDYHTDSAIQKSLRTELSEDTTVITIAHRLQTIMDSDRIMVLDAGQLVEFDSPKTLLHKKGSLFRALVEESDDRDQLLTMADVRPDILQ